MNKTVKRLIVIGLFVMALGIARMIYSYAYTGYEVKRASEGEDISISDMTKEQYIQQVKDNGGDAIEVCIYEKLIDDYGVKETLKMDMRSVTNSNDVDPRVYSIMQECL